MAEAVILAASVGSSLLGGFARHKEKKAQVEADNLQLEQEAKNEEINAFLALKEGASKAKAIRAQRDPFIGSQLSAAAASGVDISSSSVQNIIKETAYNIEMDALTAQSNARSEAAAREYRAANLRGSKRGKPSKVGILLGGFGSLANAYGQYKMAGK